MSREESRLAGAGAAALERELLLRGAVLRRQLQVEGATPRPAFSQALRQRLLDRHETARAPRRGPGWRTVIARLFSPADMQLGLAGTRGGALRLARYMAEDVTVVLKIEGPEQPGREQVTVYGAVDSAVLDDQALAASTIDLEGDHSRQGIAVDDLGNFVLSGIPVGLYRLTLRLPDGRAVLIENLSLTA